MDKEKGMRIGIVLLKTIGAVGVVGIALLAPNALQALKLFNPDRKASKREKYYIDNALQRLNNKGLVTLEKNTKGVTCIRLTKKGRAELSKYELGELTIKKPKKWDRKYRVVIFDITEKRRSTRDLIRRQLINLGFIRLQDSVWVHPYECRDVVIMLKSNACVGKDILYMTVDSIENDVWLKKKFSL